MVELKKDLAKEGLDDIKKGLELKHEAKKQMMEGSGKSQNGKGTP